MVPGLVFVSLDWLGIEVPLKKPEMEDMQTIIDKISK